MVLAEAFASDTDLQKERNLGVLRQCFQPPQWVGSVKLIFKSKKKSLPFLRNHCYVLAIRATLRTHREILWFSLCGIFDVVDKSSFQTVVLQWVFLSLHSRQESLSWVFLFHCAGSAFSVQALPEVQN